MDVRITNKDTVVTVFGVKPARKVESGFDE